jgi:hypothetical protein
LPTWHYNLKRQDRVAAGPDVSPVPQKYGCLDLAAASLLARALAAQERRQRETVPVKEQRAGEPVPRRAGGEAQATKGQGRTGRSPRFMSGGDKRPAEMPPVTTAPAPPPGPPPAPAAAPIRTRLLSSVA